MAKDGTGAKRVVDMRAQQRAVAWSPDGRWLVTAPVDRGDLTLVCPEGDLEPATSRVTGRQSRKAKAFTRAGAVKNGTQNPQGRAATSCHEPQTSATHCTDPHL